MPSGGNPVCGGVVSFGRGDGEECHYGNTAVLFTLSDGKRKNIFTAEDAENAESFLANRPISKECAR
jgi:hypothetical protein